MGMIFIVYVYYMCNINLGIPNMHNYCNDDLTQTFVEFSLLDLYIIALYLTYVFTNHYSLRKKYIFVYS